MRVGPAAMLWLDLEMTDLDPVSGKIVEIATAVTDSKLTLIAHGPNLVIHQSQTVIDNMHHWSMEHFTESGLIDEIKKSKITLKQAEERTMDFITAYFPPQVALLAGNSVYVDREFLAFHMPAIYNYVHYKVIDVNTLKELAHHWYPSVPRYVKAETHRSKFDIIESIEELKYYQQHIFKKT